MKRIEKEYWEREIFEDSNNINFIINNTDDSGDDTHTQREREIEREGAIQTRVSTHMLYFTNERSIL